MSVALLGATYAVQRGRTWGVALSFTLGVMLAGVAALGIAPLWFAFVGLLAMRPFASAFPLFTRFDRGAAVTLAALASGIGAVGAVAWKEYAFALFRALPLLSPSIYPHHGLALLALVVGAVVGKRFLPASTTVTNTAEALAEPSRVRIGDLGEANHDAAYEELESELGGQRARSVTPR